MFTGTKYIVDFDLAKELLEYFSISQLPGEWDFLLLNGKCL